MLQIMSEAFWALKVACPQVTDAQIRRNLRELKAINKANGGA